ncbi:hypothetical protein ACFL2G_01070 [Candidatus Omnitrophota bacterium]
MFYEEVFRELNRNRVRYVVAGGVAVNLHGVPRVTGDLDLLIHLDEKNVSKFSKTMKTLGYKPKAPVSIEDFGIIENRKKWIEEKDMKVFSLCNIKMPYIIIDIFVENPIEFKKLYDNRINISVGEFKIPIVSIEHLIKLKKIAGRKQDLSDIVSLRRLKELRKR